MSKIILVAAVGKRGELGKKGELIWRMPGDLKRAKELTMGHPVIMGRKTYESFPEKYRPLPGRTNIILTRDEAYDVDHTDVHIAHDVGEAISLGEQSEGGDEIYVFGGAEIYRLFLPYATGMERTEIAATDRDADASFPRFDQSDFQEVARESIDDHDPAYAFVTLARKKKQ